MKSKMEKSKARLYESRIAKKVMEMEEKRDRLLAELTSCYDADTFKRFNCIQHSINAKQSLLNGTCGRQRTFLNDAQILKSNMVIEAL